MFLRNRYKPKSLQMLDALIIRLPQPHPQLRQLKTQAAKLQKGYNGERKLDYHLKSLPNSFSILSDVTLMMYGCQVQIDSIIITDYGIFIIEVKSYIGAVTFNTGLQQCVQDNRDKLEGYKYPITQAETIQFQLLRWLQERGLGGLPIHYFVAFSERSTIINVVGDEHFIGEVVTYVDEISMRLIRMVEHMKENSSPEIKLKNRIVKEVLANCIDFDIDIMKKYNIERTEIRLGVHCPECGSLPMVRLDQKWSCTHCHHRSGNAHNQAMLHYLLLIRPEITNVECRKFLRVESRHVVNKLLKKSDLQLIPGTRRWRYKYMK